MSEDGTTTFQRRPEQEILQGTRLVRRWTARLYLSPTNGNLCCQTMTTDWYCKVMSPRAGPFRIPEGSPNTVGIDENGL